MRGRLFFAMAVFITIAFQAFAQNKAELTSQTQWNIQRYEINCMDIPVLSKSEIKVFEAEDLKHAVGYAVQGGWAVKNGLPPHDGGYMLKGGNYNKPGSGGLRVVFRVKTDSNDKGVWDKLMRLEIFDSTLSSLISRQEIERNYFRGSDQFQNFVLHADLKGRENHTLEARIWYYGNAYIEVDKLIFIIDHHDAGMPVIINQSSSSNDHIKKLINETISGLGFNSDNYDGPNANDLIFVNNYYMAWVDQTGYFGIMNGLWQLNNERGNSLNFPENTRYNGRVVNFLGVAEDGDGKWLGSYMGAEHFEVPSYIKENDDNASIGCWYSANEANPNLGTGGLGPIPWWTCCSGDMNNKQSFGQINPPDQYNLQKTQLQLKYLVPITKAVDGDGFYDGDRCQANVLFYNNIRYPVYLKLGYIFYKDKPYFDRSYQLINPAGNITLPAHTYDYICTTMLVTKTTSTIPWKGNLFSYIQPNGKAMRINRASDPEGIWSALNDPNTQKDIIGFIAAPNSSYTLSSNKSYEIGNSFYTSLYYNDSANFPEVKNDLLICQCVVHGAWEMGSTPLANINAIPAGKVSEEAIRRVGFPQGKPTDDDKLLNQKK